MIGSGAEVSRFRGFSLGAKFVGLTAGLILLLSFTALLSLRNSAQSVGQIKTVVEFAIPTYGALARCHIRSLEQAVELRRSILLAEDPAAPDDAISLHMDLFLAARAGFDRELSDAERLVEQRSQDSSPMPAALDLQELRNDLRGLRELSRSYDRETDAALQLIRVRSVAKARQRLVRIDALRQELGGRLEAIRAGMFAALKIMSTETEAAQARTQTATVLVFVLSSILGLGVAIIGATRLIRAIRSLVQGAESIEGGNLETRIEIASRDEIGRLAASFNRMTEGLRMRDRIRDMFGRYVDRRIAEHLIGSQTVLGERRVVSVMFCDLEGFAVLSERVDPERLVQFLNSYFSVMAREISETGGIIDKYIGDAVMAYWCPPFVPEEEVAMRSADAVLRCVEQLPAVAAASREIFGDQPEVPRPRSRMGLATGQSITGSIGAEERRNYTVIGDTVNLASRIEGANKLYRSTMLICARTAEAVAARFVLREVDTVLLPGIKGPQTLFEILGRNGQISREQTILREAYAMGLDAYRRGNWPEAARCFSECLAIRREDGPARTMLERVEALATTTEAGASWTGVWTLRKDDFL